MFEFITNDVTVFISKKTLKNNFSEKRIKS